MWNGRWARFCLAAAWLLFQSDGLYAQSVIRQGGEFRVNSITFNNQHEPAVALDADGDFVITWSDDIFEGSRGVWATGFNSAGAALTGQFRVNTYTYSSQRASSIAAETNGDFVVVWSSFRQDDPIFEFSYGVFGQRFNSAGGVLATEFQVNTYTPTYQQYPRVSSDADGDFVVVWASTGAQDGHSTGIFAQRFNSSGAALAVEFMVNSRTTTRQDYPAVALDADGDFVVVWESPHDGSGYGVFGQRFNSAGTRLGVEFQVNTFTSLSQYKAVVAAEADGDFVVAWHSHQQDGGAAGLKGIFARRFSSAGTPQAAEFQVNVFTLYDQRYPEIAADNAGNYVVTWQSTHHSFPQDGDQGGVFARRVSPSGAAFGPEFRVNAHTMDNQSEPAIDFDADGNFVIAWSTEYQDGNASGVFAQRFSLPPLATLDIDGNGLIEPLSDGLLNLRHRFGFGGNSLTTGAVGAGCTRCAAADITAYLNGLGLVLDIDNNGALDPLTDGLLVLRFMFGFTGTTLTNGAVAGNCVTRCDASTILPYLQMLATPGS
jgi:hypothetical protein